MATRVTLRYELMEAAEDIVIRAHDGNDARLLTMAERMVGLLERQYAGIERALDELNYAAPTQATRRMEKALDLAS